MDNIVEANASYPFSDIKIKTPKALQGGTYSARLELNDNPIVIQTPKCKTKNGIHTTVKQIYCDLLMNEDHNDFIKWLRLLQDRVRQLIFENSENWFHEAPTLDEIEYNWNDSIRTYKSVNYLIRTFIHKSKSINKISLQIFDSDENELSHKQLDSSKSIIGIIEIVGLKFSSNSFHLEICLRQIMVLKEKPLFGKCLIKLGGSSSTDKINMELKPTTPNNNVDNLLENDDETNDELEELTEITDNLDETNLVEKPENSENVTLDNTIQQEETPSHNVVEEPSHNVAEKTSETEKSVENNNDINKDKSTLSTTIVTNTVSDEVKEIEEQKTVLPIETQKKNMSVDQNLESVDENLEENVEENNGLLETSNNLENLEETITIFQKKSEDQDDLEEISLEIDESSPLTLKNPNEVYLDIYKAAREKAKQAKNEAIKAYLEAKRIKELYLLDVVDTSDEESEDEDELFSEN